MDTTDAAYRLPITQVIIPCVLLGRRTTGTGRRVADIRVPAIHSGLQRDGQPVSVELTVADRSVVEA